MKDCIFNEEVLFCWKNIDAENWKNLAKEVADIFLTNGPLQFNELHAAWKIRDLKKVERTSHMLKSSCGNIGGEKAQNILKK